VPPSTPPPSPAATAPSGGGPPPRGGPEGPDDLDDLSPDERQALAGRLEELRRQLAETPAEVVVANHAYGLFELAAIHLSQQPPSLEQARLAVDALGALLLGLAGRLGEAEAALNDALAQIRVTYVKISQSADGSVEDGTGDQPGAG